MGTISDHTTSPMHREKSSEFALLILRFSNWSLWQLVKRVHNGSVLTQGEVVLGKYFHITPSQNVSNAIPQS